MIMSARGKHENVFMGANEQITIKRRCSRLHLSTGSMRTNEHGSCSTFLLLSTDELVREHLISILLRLSVRRIM